MLAPSSIPADPREGLVFAGRVVEDFKLSSGTFVHVGSLRVAAIAAMSPVDPSDALVAGQDRDDVGLLVWPNATACRALVSRRSTARRAVRATVV